MFKTYGEGLLVDAGSSTAQAGPAGPANDVERGLSEVLACVVNVEFVPVDSHFFDDLGADSMVMARFCARVRKRDDLPSVSMQDIYRHSTIRGLAASLTDPVPGVGEPAPATAVGAAVPPPTEVTEPVGRVGYVLCGVLQLLFFLGLAYLAALILESGFVWISAGSGLVDVYLRSLLFSAASFTVMCALPIVAKWVLVGRWTRREIRVWSLAYVRFWIVKTLVRSNPLVLFAGSPLYVLYLRALGAKIGRGVVIFARSAPVCTDLLTIGAGTVIRKDSFIACYSARAGAIRTGSVTLGKNVIVGDATVLDIETSMGDDAQLGHSSSLHAGQAVPDGERWHGSPAQPTDANYRTVEPARCGSLRRAVYALLELVGVLVVAPVMFGGVVMLLVEVPRLALLLEPGHLALTGWAFYAHVVVASVVTYFGALLVGLVFVATVPRVLALAIKPDKVYRLYGFHYRIHSAIARMTNSLFFMTLFGDSSAIIHYLRWIGYDLSRVEQTGSNFGIALKHENPYLSSVGSGTVVADGLSIINADYSSTSFRVSRTSIGSRNFLGNHIAYPAQGRTGDNCLLATKVMVPIDGPVRANVGLLGSPPFEIPRSVERDTRFDHLRSGDEFRRGLAAKNRHNAVTAGLLLLVRWIHVFAIFLFYAIAVDALPRIRRVGRLRLPTCSFWCSLSATSCWSNVPRPDSGRCGRCTARSTTSRSGGTSGSGRWPRCRVSKSSTARRSRM